MNTDPQIAVVAISGVFPGAAGIARFWSNIRGGFDATSDFPMDRWNLPARYFLNVSGAPDKAYARRVCLISDFCLDPAGIELNQEEIENLEPLFHWVLSASRDALKNCNLNNLSKHRAGAILAAIALPTKTSSEISHRTLESHIFQKGSLSAIRAGKALGGRMVSLPAALVCKAFGLGGASYTLDAACASSLYALKLACDELRSYRADMMVTGGVSGADSLYTQIGFSQLQALSHSGRCAPFDRSADGLVVGEGAGILVLKRLDDALRDNDTIWGVIRGIGLSNDMRGNLLAPESDGQLRAMRAAYQEAGWRPWNVDYIECHGAGTPVGDFTETQSLKKLWDGAPSKGRCAIGSVKSMIGHLLTAAGAAGMIKSLLAMKHETLPPSLKFEQPPDNSPLKEGHFKVQTEAAPWDPREAGAPRRAAVSAFGFGGINGHVLIEEWQPDHRQKARGLPGFHSTPQTEIKVADNAVESAHDIAIVGMELCLGDLQSRTEFQHAVFQGRSCLNPLPDNRWRTPAGLGAMAGGGPKAGGFLEEVVIDLGDFRIPPGEIPDILPQQLLMLKTAARAMHDANLPLRQMRDRMGAIIGISFDYEATNYHLRWLLPQLVAQWKKKYNLPLDSEQLPQWIEQAKEALGPPLTATRTLGALGGIVASRVAREFRFGGPSFVVSAEEASGLRALEIAARMLQSRQTDAMLVGAVDLACDPRNLATLYDGKDFSPSRQIRPFDQAADGSLPGEGAVALVLKRLEDARADGDPIYAIIKGIGSSYGISKGSQDESSVKAYCTSLERTFQDAGVDPSTVRFMECHGSALPEEDDAETHALKSFFDKRIKAPEQALAIGSVKPLIGSVGAAAGLASLAKTALSLFHQLLPMMPNYTVPASALWHNAPFYFPRQTTYWSQDRLSGPRTACVAAITRDGSCMHAVLAQGDLPHASVTSAREFRRDRPMGPLPYGLFLLPGENKEERAASLKRLETLVLQRKKESPPDAVAEMESLSHIWYRQSTTLQKSTSHLSILAHSPDDLLARILDARQCLHTESSRNMGPRGGVCYLAEADRTRGEMAFIFPGSGNHYVGMGRMLGAHFPEVLRGMDRKTDRLHSQMLPHLFDPWRNDWSSSWSTQSYQALVADPLHTIFGQVIFGGQMARLLGQFNLRPDAAIGYSLGESAALFALNAWPDHGQMLARLASSELFKTELSGRCEALRRTWQIPAAENVQWRVAVVNRPSDQVDAAITTIPFVRRLIVNTPNECVIGGLDEPVQRVIKQLGCEALFLDGVVTVHCDAALSVAQTYKDLHRFPTTAVEGIRFYSCARADSYPLSSEAAADSILQQALKGFDFPATIRKAYADGVRVFLEIGPQSSCTRMIRQILGEAPHLAVTANVRGEDECLTLLKCLGTLAAAGLEVDLAPLYGYPPNHFGSPKKAGDNAIRVPVGGRPLRLPPLPLIETAPQTQTQDFPVVPPPDDKAFKLTQSPVQTVFETPEPAYLNDPIQALNTNLAAAAKAHEQFLDLSRQITRQYGEAFEYQTRLMGKLIQCGGSIPEHHHGPSDPAIEPSAPSPPPEVAFRREQCLEFAIGSIGKVLGPQFDIIDTYKVRVRLPDEPLMLVDRILEIQGEKCSLGSGRIVTEHDVRPGTWYLDGGRAPVCIAVEAGQADLFLSSYLGIDHQVRGTRAYRLLDANIRFHRGLPQAGETIRYDIHIDKFVKQGATYLFFFRYEGHIGDEHLITMTDGCAGFFTEQEVRNSGGIILSEEDRAPGAKINGEPFSPILPLEKTAYDDTQVEALRSGDAAGCFGDLFRDIHLPSALRLPAGRMRLIDRIVELAPEGGRWGLGSIRAEADIHPDDWFLTCHFVDDKVMPGTLMYECCAHTLRVLLLRLGWVTDQSDACYEPVKQVPCRLKCRGPVTPATRKVHYMVEIKEIGYHPEPYVVVDAHMYADGHYIVFFKDMSMQMTGLTRSSIETYWQRHRTRTDGSPPGDGRPPRFTREQILQFAVGSPSKAFGEPYAVFDEARVIARLPGPPYFFMDRVVSIEPQPWVLKADGWVEAEYDVPPDAWYFAADASGVMPFCVLLEIALQPCGWLAAYAGSALHSQKDLKFRNLGGKAKLHANLAAGSHSLTMRTRLSKVSEAADMIIEDFDFEVLSQGRPLYTGTTNFGFFTAQALSQQVGLRDTRYTPGEGDKGPIPDPVFSDMPPLTPEAAPRGIIFEPTGLCMPSKALRMIDGIEAFNLRGGPHGLGYVRGYKMIDPDEWFFKAHFFQDPVCPGSLGVESFLQLLKYDAMQRWPEYLQTHRFEMVCNGIHEWQYRGQIIPTNQKVVVEAVITKIEAGAAPLLMADGWLQVDNLCIYKMNQFGLRLVPIT